MFTLFGMLSKVPGMSLLGMSLLGTLGLPEVYGVLNYYY